MRLGLIIATSTLALICLSASASAQCDDNKSQQNAADEAAVRGDLKAGSKCATPGDTARSEQKNEDAAVRTKGKIDEKSGTDGRSGASAQGNLREKSPAAAK
jgi:hypothetical protein